MDTKLNRHNRNVVEILYCIGAFSDTVINIYLYRKLITFKAIASPDRFLWSSQPMYVTFEYCLILMLPYFISNVPIFFFLFLVEKRIDLVLFSPKWMLNLFSRNQSNMLQKFLVSSLFIWSRSLCWYRKHVWSAYRNRSQSTSVAYR